VPGSGVPRGAGFQPPCRRQDQQRRCRKGSWAEKNRPGYVWCARDSARCSHAPLRVYSRWPNRGLRCLRGTDVGQVEQSTLSPGLRHMIAGNGRGFSQGASAICFAGLTAPTAAARRGIPGDHMCPFQHKAALESTPGWGYTDVAAAPRPEVAPGRRQLSDERLGIGSRLRPRADDVRGFTRLLWTLSAVQCTQDRAPESR